MLLWVYIHTGQAWTICLATVGVEPTTFGILAHIGSIPTEPMTFGILQAYFSSLPGVDIHRKNHDF